MGRGKTVSLVEAHAAAGAIETRIKTADPSSMPSMRRESIDLGAGLRLSTSISAVSERIETEASFQACRSLIIMLSGHARTEYEHIGFVDLLPGQWTLISQPSRFATKSRVEGGQVVRLLSLRVPEEWAAGLIDDDAGDPLARLLGVKGPHRASGSLNAEALKALEALQRNEANGACRRLVATARVFDLLAAIATTSQAVIGTGLSRAGRIRSDDARNILLSDLVNPPTIVELARMVGTSPTTLKREFQQVYGETIGRFIAEHRLLEARSLLESGNLRVSDVAYRIGYTPAAFSAAFLRRFGQQPRTLCRD